MGYYRHIYAGPFIEVEPKQETKTTTFFGCPICQCAVSRPKPTDQLMLFPDPPITHTGKKHKGQEIVCEEITKVETVPRGYNYEYMNKFEEEYPDFEDTFDLLQRHCNERAIRLAPNDRRKGVPRSFTYEINEEPVILAGSFNIENEKKWMQEAYQKEIDILNVFFASVKMGWGFVVDGG